jgi:hypothetical protein
MSRDRLIHEAMWRAECGRDFNFRLLRAAESLDAMESWLIPDVLEMRRTGALALSPKRPIANPLGPVPQQLGTPDIRRPTASPPPRPTFTIARAPQLAAHCDWTVRRYVCHERPAEIATGLADSMKAIERATARVAILLELPKLRRGAPRGVPHATREKSDMGTKQK